MITADPHTIPYDDEDSYTDYHDGNMWLRHYKHGAAVLYHDCPHGHASNVLLKHEVKRRRCGHCREFEIPNDLWTLYVMLDGEGAR
jgi:hypothetical protein